MKELKKNEGITLIALIITIIVLLILAAVTLSMIFGEDGIINKANTAKEATTYSQEKELVNLGYLEWKTDSWDKTNKDEVKLKVGQKGEIDITGDATNGWTVTFTATGHVYEVDPDTGLKDGTSGENDLQNILKTATKPEGQTVRDDIGIDQRGEIVNLDYWKYDVLSDHIALVDPGYFSFADFYTGPCDKDTDMYMPKYIKIKSNGNILPVTVIGHDETICGGITTKMLHIPDTVTYIASYTFSEEVIYGFDLPESLTGIGESAFINNPYITSITIPSSVTTMGANIFRWCPNLTDIYVKGKASAPSTWDSNWLGGCSATVHWNQ